MNIKCLIIDDEEPTIQHLIKYINKVPYLKLEKYFLDPADAIEYLSSNIVDIIFVDIEMPNSELDGIDFIKIMGNAQNYILTTSHPKYALDGFDYSAIDFLHKPYSYDRFLEAVKKIKDLVSRKKTNETTEDEYIIIKVEKGYNKILLNEISYISSEKNYINIYSNDECFKTLFTMQSIEEKLPSHTFMRVHKSFIINLNKIKTFNIDDIIIKKGMSEKHIPLGDIYKKKFMEYFDSKILKSS
jgi:two-component system, LytTR family, response regulator